MTLGEKITHLRLSKGLSQETLAEKLSVSRQAVSKWERGEGKPDTYVLLKISEIYGVSIR